MEPEVTIDGSRGEGGGQILRTAVGLAARTGRAVLVTDVRTRRPQPGLRPQHVAALHAVAAACRATVEGAVVGSTRVRFVPGALSGGAVEADPGTAGSTTMMLHAVAAAAPALPAPLVLDARGGTDTAWAPTLVHATRVFLPALARCGVASDVLEACTGFYPRGGGRLRVRFSPTKAAPTFLAERGALRGIDVHVRVARLPEHVGERVAEAAVEALARAGREARATIERVEVLDPGVVVDAVARFEHATLGANALGEKGVPSEVVGARCGSALVEELASAATVDVHLADQLVPFCAWHPGAGFVVREVTAHLRTNADVVAAFGGWPARFELVAGGTRVTF